MSKTILMTASIFLILAVAIGAFGAHGLKNHLSNEMLQIFKTGVEYHFYHGNKLICNLFASIKTIIQILIKLPIK